MQAQVTHLCQYGNLESIKKLLQNNQNINIYDSAFRIACGYGHLAVAQWLLSVKPDINISAEDNWAFSNACEMGHLEVAKWLLQVKPDIDISTYEEYAFRQACSKGHLEVAQWLLSVKPAIDISACDDYAFGFAIYFGRLDIAKWLQSLNPYLYVIKYDYNGNYAGCKIRSKEEANWEKRKYALHMMTKQDNTKILYNLPIDISKTIALFV